MIQRLLIAPIIVLTCIAWGTLSIVYVYICRARGI